MNPILEALLVAACATSSAFIFCAMLGLAWHVIQPNHEADLPAHPLDQDREFIDLETRSEPLRSSRSSVESENSVLSTQHSALSSFQHDTAYDFQNPKRF